MRRVRHQSAGGCQQADYPFLFAQVAQVDVQGAGEKEKTEHAVHQGFVEVDRLQQSAAEAKHGGRILADQDQDERQHQGEHHHADGRRQPEHPGIDVTENRRERDESGEDLENGHFRLAEWPRSDGATIRRQSLPHRCLRLGIPIDQRFQNHFEGRQDLLVSRLQEVVALAKNLELSG